MTTRRRRQYREPLPEPLLDIATKRHGPDSVDISRPVFDALKGAVSFIPVDHSDRHALFEEIWDWLYKEFHKGEDPAYADRSKRIRPESAMETRYGPDLQNNKTHAAKHKP